MGRGGENKRSLLYHSQFLTRMKERMAMPFMKTSIQGKTQMSKFRGKIRSSVWVMLRLKCLQNTEEEKASQGLDVTRCGRG